MSDSDSPRWHVWLAMTVIVASSLAAYGNTFSNAFVYPHVADIVANPSIRHLWQIGAVLQPPATEGFTVGGRPVLNLSLAVNYALGGTSVWGYHAVNLAIHILAGLTLFGIIRRTAGMMWRLTPPVATADSSGPAAPDPTFFAFAVALLWTLHPLQTESVTYVTERAESLMGLFYLLTLYCFIRYAKKMETRVTWAALAILACVLGMATKEVMVSAPVIVLLYDRTFVSGNFRKAWRDHGWVYGALAATWLLVAYLALHTSGRGGTAGFGTGLPWWTYAQTQFGAIVHYLRLAVWPHPLVLDYGTPWAKGLGEVWPSALIVAGLIVVTAAGLRRRLVAGFLGAFFFAILAPTSLVPVFVQPVAERRMYLALAPVIFGLVWAGHVGLLRAGAARLRLPVLLLLALALGFTTAARNRDYRDNLTLWTVTAAQRPEVARAHYLLGFSLAVADRPTEAMPEFQKAIQLNPNYLDAYVGLGTVLDKNGRLREAIACYREALRLKPDYTLAHYNLGSDLARVGRSTEAISELEEAVRLKPDYADAHNNLALLLAGQPGREADAVAEFEIALRVQPNSAPTHYNLWCVLERLPNRQEQAALQFTAALRINPDLAPAREALKRLQSNNR